jgi:3-oxoacyl-[acyl-carrier-protein] synthase II
MSVEIAITGMGVCSLLGDGIEANWKALRQAESHERSQEIIAGWPRTQELSLKAVKEALAGAGLLDGEKLRGVDPQRFGCTFSASKPLFLSVEGPDGRVVPPDAINQWIKEQFGFSGESRNVIAACATGAYSVAMAASWLEQGLCDAVVAGSVEPYPNALIQAGFQQMGVLTKESWMRPFDSRRSGFVFGEGAGAIVLETVENARARGQEPLALLSGWGLGTDPNNAIAFNSSGQFIADVIQKSLGHRSLSARMVGHVNAHGTATRLNDRIETQALMKAFGSHAQKLMISATKSSTGHMLGAAGSVEFIYTVLALRSQFIPPTLHLSHVDPDCPLDYTPLEGHRAKFDHALSLSFGFGGPIASLVVSRG